MGVEDWDVDGPALLLLVLVSTPNLVSSWFSTETAWSSIVFACWRRTPEELGPWVGAAVKVNFEI